MNSEALTFVTVLYELETELLELQARSMACHMPSDLVSEIIVVDNCLRPTSETSRRELVPLYGALADRVRFVTPASVPKLPWTVGSRSQQVLKMRIASDSAGCCWLRSVLRTRRTKSAA